MNIYDLNQKTGKLAIEFCVKTFGTKFGLDTPRLAIHRLPSKNGYLGMYDSGKNTIHVFKSEHSSFLEAMDTIIHEYTHYLQNMTAYMIFQKTGTPYKENPYEIEAFEMGRLYKKSCKKYISTNL